MRDDREDLIALVTEAVQRLRDLDTDIRQQGAVDPALIWIAYRVREVEELLSPVERESVRRWASSNADQAGVRGRTFEAPALSEALAASSASGLRENPRRLT